MEHCSVPAAAYTDVELDSTLRTLGAWWDVLVAGIDPAPVVGLRTEQAEVLGGPTVASGATRLRKAWHAGTVGRAEVDRVLDRSLALLGDAGRRLAVAGAFATATGAVHGLFRSGGGVPKAAVDEARVDGRGVEGDRQAARRHHGRPWQALCLWSLEVVEQLVAEGHPITPGAAGENVSTTGIDWALVRPGTRLALGPEVVVEVSTPATPCAKNARWFTDGRFSRIHHDHRAGVSRMYASVLVGGTVRPGDTVTLEP